MLVLKNCRLIPELTEGFDLPRGNVLIDGRLIVDIRPVDFEYNPDYLVIDVEGKTLLPGLIDLHTHLCCDTFNYDNLIKLPAGAVLFNACAYAKAYVRAGYTTVRDCGALHNATVYVTEAIKKGIVEGPRLLNCGQILTPTETGNDTFGCMYTECDGVEEVKKAARQQLKLGNDFIKYMATGAFLNEKGDPGQLITTREELRAAVEVAALKNTYVAAHCHSDMGIRAAIDAGVRTVEHAAFITEDTVNLLLKRKDMFIVPTAAIGMVCLEDGNEDVTPDELEKSVKYEKLEKAALNMCYAAGLKLGFGSDIDLASFLRVPGYEFIARKEFYSFSDKDILLQSTKNSAEIAGIHHMTGTIKAGKAADLIVVDGKPEEDIYVMTKKPVHVFAEGRKINLEN